MAAKIPEATVDKILRSVNISDYVGQIVQLHKQGQNLFGLCPFHEENTPSFSVNEARQIFYCFSCHRGGNVFKFVMDYENLTFPEAVKKVADFANIPLSIQSQSTRPIDPALAAQRKLLADTTDLFHHILMNTEEGEDALTYLHERGLTDETITRFQLGYAPKNRQVLGAFLDHREVDYQTKRASGLFVEDQDGKLFDRFSDRVMFPLNDQNGNVIGFSGRILTKTDNVAKYLNSPETALFTKSDVIYNLHRAKQAIGRGAHPILFEGFMDVIAADQAGVQTGIASMGTSLTNDQLDIISHLSKTITICYDGDAPGQAATDRAVEMIAKHPRLQADVVVLPEQMDPDEFIHTRGAEAFAAQVTTVLSTTGFKLQFLASGVDLTNEQAKLTYIDQALAVVSREVSPVARSVYLKQISEVAHVPVSALEQSLSLARPNPIQQTQNVVTPMPSAPVTSGDRYQIAQQQLLFYAWHDELIAKRLRNVHFRFPNAQYDTLFQSWLNFLSDRPDGQLASFLDQVPLELSNVAAATAVSVLPESNEATITALIDTIEAFDLVDELANVRQALVSAQRLGDKTQVQTLTMKYVNLTKQLKQTEKGRTING